jgi:DNA-binding NarL/FixJ family response regulator
MNYKLLIAEPSDIIRRGLCALVEDKNLFSKIKEVACMNTLHQQILSFKPDMIIINPAVADKNLINGLKAQQEEVRLVAVVYALFETEVMSQFDEVIMIGDNASKVVKKLEQVLTKPAQGKVVNNQQLSQREIDVLKLLVKGHNTKEISETLFISTHTVVSHRKNISQKLGIKSLAGLTVYAIINELIHMDDVQ